MEYNNREKYNGDWINDKKEGNGIYIFKIENKKFKGNWLNDNFINGEILYSNGDIYNGNIYKNKRNGEGEMKYIKNENDR